jgi:hypothetical protein
MNISSVTRFVWIANITKNVEVVGLTGQECLAVISSRTSATV